MTTKTKMNRNHKVNEFLNTLFETKTGYCELMMNGFILIRQGGEKLCINIFTPQTYTNYKNSTKLF